MDGSVFLCLLRRVLVTEVCWWNESLNFSFFGEMGDLVSAFLVFDEDSC